MQLPTIENAKRAVDEAREAWLTACHDTTHAIARHARAKNVRGTDGDVERAIAREASAFNTYEVCRAALQCIAVERLGRAAGKAVGFDATDALVAVLASASIGVVSHVVDALTGKDGAA